MKVSSKSPKKYATKIVFYIDTNRQRKQPYNVVDLPIFTWGLHIVILYLLDPNFEAWWAHFIFSYPHLH